MLNSFSIYYTELSIIFFEAVLLLILLSNLRRLRRLGEDPPPSRWPRMSVLVPARNEEINIEACARSLLAQQYPDFQVLVLDDNSSDRTWPIISQLTVEDPRLQIYRGEALPAGWLGKHWACHQLAQTANGELLLFTDADTRHHPLTLRQSVSALAAEDADLLTALPREIVVSWAERLLVPLIPWSIVAFIPLGLAYRLRLPVLSAAIGQFMLFRRQAYDQIGGYEAVRHHVVDDLALVRRVKSHGLRWRLADGAQQVRCRMYRNFNEVYQGLSKNLFAAFDYKVLPFLFVWFFLGCVFWTPLLILASGLTGVQWPAYSMALAGIAIALALMLWGVVEWRFGFPRYLMFFYPITILLSVTIALRSIRLTVTNRATWKGRTLVRQKIS
jgi:chlorobactene glucosyltransferase